MARPTSGPRRRSYTPLRRAASIAGGKRNPRWKLIVNVDVEPDERSPRITSPRGERRHPGGSTLRSSKASFLGVKRAPFKVENPWFSGRAEVSTYAIDELLCTKLRALYQRKKGRDLFDVWYALDLGRIDPETLLTSFDRYMNEEKNSVSRAQFEANLAEKRKRPDFRDDVGPILRPGLSWDFDTAMDAVLSKLVARLPGDPWKGKDHPG